MRKTTEPLQYGLVSPGLRLPRLLQNWLGRTTVAESEEDEAGAMHEHAARMPDPLQAMMGGRAFAPVESAPCPAPPYGP